MRHRLPGLIALCIAPAAVADDRADLRFDAREAIARAAATQPEAATVDNATAPDAHFAEQSDQWWVTIGAAAGGVIGRDDAFGQGYLTLSTFVADRFEVGAEFGGWFLSLDGTDDTGAASASVIFRWHFLVDTERDDWTVFASAGVGGLFSGDDVPDGGKEFNFLPTAGVGFTHRLGDGPNRVIGGVRWQHISNARLAGGDDNPGRDFGTLYLGVMFPF